MNRITALAATVALTAGSLALTAPAQAAAAKAQAYKITAKANTEVAVAKEDVVKVRGRVTPRAAGEKVVLQQRVGNKKSWKSTGNTRIKKNGTYVLKDRPTTPGPREYRVLKPGSRGISKGYSKPVAVEVYRWQKLASRRVGPSENVTTTSVYIGAGLATRSLVTIEPGVPASVEYTLGRKCVELRARYALTDESATGSSGAISVSADGAVLTSHSLAVGTIVEEEPLDVSDVFRLKVDVSTTATPAAFAAMARPEVLCTR
jgi:hypothetical protein